MTIEETVTMFLDLERDPPSAGRALQRQFCQDYDGTLRRIRGLSPADQRLLAAAYCAYHAQVGGSAELTADALLVAWRG